MILMLLILKFYYLGNSLQSILEVSIYFSINHIQQVLKSIFHVPNNVLGTWGASMNKAGKDSFLHGAYILTHIEYGRYYFHFTLEEV